MATPVQPQRTPTPTPKPDASPQGTSKNTPECPSEVPQPATPRKGAEHVKMDNKEGSPVQNTRNADRPKDRDLTVEDDGSNDGATNTEQDEDEVERAARERDTEESK